MIKLYSDEEKLASVDVSKRDLDNDLFYLTLKRPILVAAPKVSKLVFGFICCLFSFLFSLVFVF